MTAVVVLHVLIVLCIKWSLAPRRTTSTAFMIYKSVVVVAAWLAFVLSSAGTLPGFAGQSTPWLMLFGAVLLSLPTFIIVRTPPAPLP